MDKVSDVLIVTDSQWYEDFCDQKYRLIHLTITQTSIPTIDLFMLAVSRLYHQGEFIIRLKPARLNHDLIQVASAFDFSLVNTTDRSHQYVFRFNGKQTKLGYAMAQAKTYSDDCMILFKEVFGAAISTRFWHWKYPRDKKARSVVAVKNNKVVAHYGLCDRNAVCNDAVWGASQACDVMIAPKDRGAIRSGIFYELVKLGEQPFYTDDSISIIYGFPHGRHYKLGARLKLYAPVSPILEVVFNIPGETANDSGSNCTSGELITVSSNEKKDIEIALQSMYSVKDTFLLKRDYQYLLQRYVHHPEYHYDIYRFQGSYFIIKAADGNVCLMDYWGDLAAYPKNLEDFIHFLSSRYAGYALHLWCLEDISTSFITPHKVVNTGAFFVCRRYSYDLPDIKQWWITMGDTEFQ